MSKKNYLDSKKHREEHSRWDRRGFLKVLGIAGAGSISLGNTNISVLNSNFLTNALSDSLSDRVLVLIRLKGGNDGLNTIIPVYDYDTYVSKRPSIHIPKNNLIISNKKKGNEYDSHSFTDPIILKDKLEYFENDLKGTHENLVDLGLTGSFGFLSDISIETK